MFYEIWNIKDTCHTFFPASFWKRYKLDYIWHIKGKATSWRNLCPLIRGCFWWVGDVFGMIQWQHEAGQTNGAARKKPSGLHYHMPLWTIADNLWALTGDRRENNYTEPNQIMHSLQTAQMIGKFLSINRHKSQSSIHIPTLSCIKTVPTLKLSKQWHMCGL